MNKGIKNILILFIVIICVVGLSYVLFASGITSKLSANVNRMDAKFNEIADQSYYPLITLVVNSSGERLVNTNVAVTVFAESNYNIDKVYYSFDNKTWYEGFEKFEANKSISTKIVFKDNITKDIYIKVENEKGYKSYAYKTSIKIDKLPPTINIFMDKVYANDNYMLSSIQYSNDAINWIDMEVDKNDIKLDINKEYKFIRAVDKAGNISDVKQVK